MPTTSFDTDTPVHVNRFRLKEGERTRIGFPLDRIHHAYVHWTREKGYAVCTGGECCERADIRQHMFLTPVLVYTDSWTMSSNPNTWQVMGWQFPSNKYQQIMDAFRSVDRVGADLLVSCQNGKFQRYHFTASDEDPWWRGDRDLWVRRAEEVFMIPPKWLGYHFDAEMAAEQTISRIELLMENQGALNRGVGRRGINTRLSLLLE